LYLEPKQIRLLVPKTIGGPSPATPPTSNNLHLNQNAKEKEAAAAKDHGLYTVPDNQASVASLGIQNDGVLYMVFAQEDGKLIFSTF
jgi:hypothetical protein